MLILFSAAACSEISTATTPGGSFLLLSLLIAVQTLQQFAHPGNDSLSSGEFALALALLQVKVNHA